VISLLIFVKLIIIFTVVALSNIAPGLLLYCLFHSPQHEKKNLLLFMPVYTILFYFCFYLILDGFFWHVIGIDLHHIVWTAAWVVSLIFLWLKIKKDETKRTFVKDLIIFLRQPLKLYFLFSLLCLVLVTYDVKDPFEDYSFIEVAHKKTFWKKPAHDNYFQFINAKAIINREPFEKYYGNKRLTYQVQDRQSFAAVMFSAFNRITAGFDSYTKNHYLYFEMFGILLNAMILFPLIFFLLTFFPQCSIYWVLSLSIFNPYTIMNTYYVWFKLTAGAFFLIGLAWLLTRFHKKQWTDWVVCGLIWGIAAAFHSSTALGFPFIIIWLIWKSRRHLFKSVVYAGILTSAFVITQIPWTIIKKIHFEDTHVLVRQNFMNNFTTSPYEGLLTTGIEFLKQTSFEEQFSQRIFHVKRALHFPELTRLYGYLEAKQFGNFVMSWSAQEFLYILFVYLPYILLTLLMALVYIIRHKALPKWTKEDNPIPLELFWISLVTFGLLVILAYDKGERAYPDRTYHLPMGLISFSLVYIHYKFQTLKGLWQKTYIAVSVLIGIKFLIAIGIYSLIPPILPDDF